MTNEEYIDELRNLVRQAEKLFDAENLHENENFRKWRQKLTALLIAGEEKGYNVESDVISRDFDILVAYGPQPSPKDRMGAFNRDLQDTINELETIIEHFGKFGKSTIKNVTANVKTGEYGHISMKGIKVPVWLIAICVFVFLAVILEQLYISKNVVDIWGLKFGRSGNTAIEIDSLSYKYITKQFSDVREPSVIPESRNVVFCALTHVDDDAPQGACTVSRNEGTKEWLFSTGEDGDANSCFVTCMWIELKKPNQANSADAKSSVTD